MPKGSVARKTKGERMKLARRRALAIFLFVVMTITAAGSVPFQAHAETTLERLQRAKEEKNKTENTKKDAENKVNQLQITQDSLLGQLSILNDDLAVVSDNLEKIEEKIVNQETEIENTKLELAEAVRVEEEQYEEMKIRIRHMYESGNQNIWDLFFSSISFGDFLNKSEYVERINRYDQKKLTEYREAKEYVEQVKAELEDELVVLEGYKEETVIEQQKVSSLVQQTANNVAAYADQIEDAEETIDTLEAMLAEQENDIAALQKQYEEELALSKLALQSAWRDISEIQFEEGDRYLLANLIYCEAGGEPYEGQVAVGAVVMNRVLSSRYPNTVVGVIYQRKQFSPVLNGKLAIALAQNKATASCYRAADEAMSGITNVGQCLYFRTPIPGLTGIRIGGHIFY